MAMQRDDTMTTILRTTARGLRALAVPVVCALALTGCDVDEFLNTQPIGELTGSTFYQSEEDFEAATLGPYSTMLNLTYDQFGLGWWNGFLIPDDDVQFRDPNNANDFFNWTADNGDFAWVWQQSYKGIMRANIVIQQLPEAQNFTDEANKARYEAEAKYMRAYWYFLLARNWGNVPVLTEVVSSVDAAKVGNSETGEVWDLIESDLDFAVDNLPPSYPPGQVGRATHYSALALLGKVELYRAQWGAAAGVSDAQGKYQEAITHLEQVVDGPFSLVDDYGDNFRVATENNAESLFEVQHTLGDNVNAWGTTDLGYGAAGHAWPIYVSPSCFYDASGGHCAPGAWGHGYGQIDITQSLQDEFEPGDPRYYYTMYSTGETYAWTSYNFDWDNSHSGGVEQWSRTAHTPAKYNRPFDAQRYPNNLSTNNLRIIRYADVLLMLAEAYVHTGQGDPVPLVNEVRQRARTTYDILCNGGSPPPTLDCTLTNVVPDLGSVTFADIEHERRVELALEVHRYDDLVRWHRAGLIDIPTFVDWGYADNDNWEERHLLKPIPQGERDLNPNLDQNDY